MATGGVGTDPDSDTDESSSPVAQFPESKAYALKFHFPSKKVKPVHIDEETVVVLDSDDKRSKLESVNTIFSRATEGHVDHEKRMIILSYKGTLPKHVEDSWKNWMKVVKEKLNHEIGTDLYKVVRTGPGAGMWRRQVEAKFSPTALFCTASKDDHSLLLLSKDRQSLDDAELVLASGGEFVTSKKLRVSVYKGDITGLTVEAIVSAVDEELSFSGGVSQAIAKAAGDALVQEARRHTAEGPVKVTEVVVTTGGRLHCKKVLHAVGPRWTDYGDKDQCKKDLTETVYNCLVKASDLGLKTIGIPAISSGTFQVPRDVSAHCYQMAVKKFDDREGTTSLQHIFFVDINEFLIHGLRKSFSGFQTKCPEDKSKKELRVAIVGGMGVGKSALGNSILKQKKCFISQQSFKAVTDASSRGCTELTEYQLQLQVVDTPGLFQAGKNDDKRVRQIQKEIVRSMSLLLPGPHVILVVFRVGRFQPSETAIYKQIQDIFSELYNHMIVVFTHIESDDMLKELLEEPADDMKELIDHCKGRVAAIDNDPSQSDPNPQVDKLITKILDLYKANNEGWYSNEVIVRCEQLMRSAENAEKSLEEIKQEVLAGNEEGVKRVLKNPEVQKTVQKASSKCTFL